MDDWQRHFSQIQWQSDVLSSLSLSQAQWLLDEGSMTQRCKQHCRQLGIELLHQGYIEDDRLHCGTVHIWRRDILMIADGTPWILARTDIPVTTLTGEERRLLSLGTMPLGHYLFSHPDFKRGDFTLGYQDELWARKAEILLSGKPLLLTEIFLPDAPLYQW